MTRSLSLHHLIAPDAPAEELVRIAAELGCRHVCLFTEDPQAGTAFPTLGDADIAGLARTLADEGVTALGVTSFVATPKTDVGDFARGLDRGARLGASVANMRIRDPDEGRATETFGRFAASCSRCGLTACLEFLGYRDEQTLPRAVRMIEAAGSGALTLDALHFVRSGASLEALASVACHIGYLQLCDGPREATEAEYRHEAAHDRLPPGRGEFPLQAILALAPVELPISLEVPCEGLRAAGLSPRERAALIVAEARRVARPRPRNRPTADTPP